ncbi:MAG TPA: hypothetical protein VM452_14005 [Caulifigura sp.]|jgi:hypothetical protein|nr:hypothetical protein [Caulifigura sp.]
MSRFASAPTIGNRLFRAGLTALYAAIALLGSGGLHAIAPHEQATCCLPRAEETSHTHSGCHHHHAHSHAVGHHSHTPAPSQPCQDQPCDDEPCQDRGCAICEIMATPVTPAAVVDLPPLVELSETIEPAVERHVAAFATSPFWIRGPPAVS